jgi:hypothetical protein
MESAAATEARLRPTPFYGTFHGHLIKHLEVVYTWLKQQGAERVVWLAGGRAFTCSR